MCREGESGICRGHPRKAIHVDSAIADRKIAAAEWKRFLMSFLAGMFATVVAFLVVHSRNRRVHANGREKCPRIGS